MLGICETGFWANIGNFIFPAVTHRIFKKLWRYFPDPLGIRESFREIAAWRKRVNHHVTELAGLHSFDWLNKTDVIWSSTESEDMEAAPRSIVEATSWMDWWTFAMRSLALKSTNDGRLVRRLSLAGARCQLLVAKTASTLWANISLRAGMWSWLRSRTLMSFESFMDLRNSTISLGDTLFPVGVPKLAIEKASKVLHDETIRKTLTCAKPANRGRKLQF